MPHDDGLILKERRVEGSSIMMSTASGDPAKKTKAYILMCLCVYISEKVFEKANIAN